MNKAILLLAALLAPTLAQAQGVIDFPRVTVTCGQACQTERNRQLIENMMVFQELESEFRAAYASRQQFMMVLNEEFVVAAAASFDLRCNAMARQVIGTGVDTSSQLSAQKAAAEQAVTLIRNTLGAAGFNDWINRLPRQSGRTSFDVAFTNAPILSIAWANGSQSDFTMVQGGSGWGVGAHVTWRARPSTETTACPV